MNNNTKKLDVKIMAFDLDDTLLNEKKEITPRTLSAIQKAASKGIYIVLCSGRAENGILPYVRTLNIAGTQQGRFLIGFNGADIFDLHTRQSIYSETLDGNIQRFVNKEAEKRGLAAVTYDPSTIYAGIDSEWARMDADLCNLNFVKVDNFDSFLKIPRPKMLVPADPEEIKKFKPILADALKDKVDVFISKPFFLEVMPSGVGKGQAILWLADYLGISYKQTMAFGDSMNDESMIRQCEYSVAMSNGLDYIKEISTFVTKKDNNNDGIADFLEEYVL